MAEDERPFVIAVRHRWTLWILPTIAALYFLAVIILNVMNYRIEGVTNEMLVLGGLGIFILVILIELPFFMRRSAPKPKRAAAPMEAQSPGGNDRWDDELLITSENQQGLQVVEYSAPAKSRHANSVFTKTYVPVTGAHMLRIETLAADQTEI